MASGIFKTLPEELLSDIERALPFQDRLQLSTVDSRFRRCLAPGLYATIRFTNRLAEQDAIADIVTKYGRYARGLALTLDLAVPDPEMTEIDQTEDPRTATADANWSAPGLPTFARDLLVGKTLPEISSFSIRFMADPDGQVGFRGDDFEYDDWVSLWGYMYSEDADEQLAEAEQQAGWRQCLAATWQALAENPGPIRHLSVSNLIPAPSSAWREPAWAAFMGRLESLSLGMWGTQGILDDEEYECQDVQGMLDRDWYAHATALRRLEIVAGPGNLYATAVWGEEVVALENGALKLPSLRELRIVDCLLSGALARLIAARAMSSLRRVELVNCASGEPYVDAQDPDWTSFFCSINHSLTGADGRPRWDAAVESILDSDRSFLVLLHNSDKLAKLGKMDEAEVYSLEKRGMGPLSLAEYWVKNEQLAQQVRELIGQLRDGGHDVDENEVVFPYVYRDPRSGSVRSCVHATVARAADGRDAVAYKHFMEYYVKCNGERN
ncbi:hypothetical protein PG984_003410 [Apiospora sp. TS-2023a]